PTSGPSSLRLAGRSQLAGYVWQPTRWKNNEVWVEILLGLERDKLQMEFRKPFKSLWFRSVLTTRTGI
ncbi:MAG: hypothetical protein WAN65_30405, partial [Candidatus Sulfotelmatobacter sp.]